MSQCGAYRNQKTLIILRDTTIQDCWVLLSIVSDGFMNTV